MCEGGKGLSECYNDPKVVWDHQAPFYLVPASGETMVSVVSQTLRLWQTTATRLNRRRKFIGLLMVGRCIIGTSS